MPEKIDEGDLIDSLFAQAELAGSEPLASRMRPDSVGEYFFSMRDGREADQLRAMASGGRLFSMILSGPPGSGKTTLALLLIKSSAFRCERLNAASVTLTDVKAALDRADKSARIGAKRTALFIDEIHRLNKMSQDALLAQVERGVVVLIGATTENPFFLISRALLSRCKVFFLEKLDNGAIRSILERAMADKRRGYGNLDIDIDGKSLDMIASCANGDARLALNMLERCVESALVEQSGESRMRIGAEMVKRFASGNLDYDKDGQGHYDAISAFIKSIRGSDPDASLYYLFRMIERGEDPLFIFRRMLISAAEDIGLADPFAITIVQALHQAFQAVGMPEGEYHLAMAALYLALTHKSDSVGGFRRAKEAARENLPIPGHIVNYGPDAEKYEYPHAFPFHYSLQDYLPENFRGARFYEPGELGFEKKLKELHAFRERLRAEGFSGAKRNDD